MFKLGLLILEKYFCGTLSLITDVLDCYLVVLAWLFPRGRLMWPSLPRSAHRFVCCFVKHAVVQIQTAPLI